jgi:uncharacterized protein with HEPN domain
MTEQAKKYLSDILIAIELIESFTEGINDFYVYQEDEKTKSAVERQRSIVGEAVNKFRKEEIDYQLTHTQQIVAFRNRIVHVYDSVDDSIVWAILKNHLPTLKSEVLIGLDQGA